MVKIISKIEDLRMWKFYLHWSFLLMWHWTWHNSEYEVTSAKSNWEKTLCWISVCSVVIFNACFICQTDSGISMYIVWILEFKDWRFFWFTSQYLHLLIQFKVANNLSPMQTNVYMLLENRGTKYSTWTSNTFMCSMCRTLICHDQHKKG